MIDGQQFRPGGPVYESGPYAALTPDGHTLGEWFIPAGAMFPPTRERGAYYVLVGLPQAISH